MYRFLKICLSSQFGMLRDISLALDGLPLAGFAICIRIELSEVDRKMYSHVKVIDIVPKHL